MFSFKIPRWLRIPGGFRIPRWFKISHWVKAPRWFKIPQWLKTPWLKITEWRKRIFNIIDKKIVLPFMNCTIYFLSERIRRRTEYIKIIPDWKKRALEDFQSWIKEIPDVPSVVEQATMDSCDLYSLLSEFSALRQEIRMQNREQKRTLTTLDGFVKIYQETEELLNDKFKRLAKFEEGIRRATEKKTAIPFLDIRDALVRGHKASLDLKKTKSFFRRLPPGIDSVIEGYEMAIRRFDHALEFVNIYPVETIGHSFDPKTMKAVDTRSVPDVDKGKVIEEQLGGFVRDEEVIRTAEVIVNQ